ncbi:gliding motility-associated C-terminal domain-containing protein, partial [uncultured Winogradskyella sp.]|uniref:DUF7507 domain-containing protein n=1 Tax=uncultured Winogradskyella sp. TaxID=395353 RepID=UPI002616B8D3
QVSTGTLASATIPVIIIDGAVGSIDIDNDGIPNRLDLDSDNDGCSDAFEAGTITTEVADITVAPFDATNVGDNGFEDSLETAAESGLYNGTYTYDRAIEAIQLTVDTAPTNQTVNDGDAASFAALATADAATSYTTGTPNYGTPDNANDGVNYQWYIGDPDNGGTVLANGGVYSNVDTATLNISDVTGLDGTDYCVLITHDDNVCIREINCSTLTVNSDPCDAIISGNLDTDNDGISDYCDDDDDNDGILDINDLNCPTGPLTLGQTFSDTTGSTNNPEFVNNLYAFDGADIRFGYELRGGAAWNGGVTSQNNAAVLPDGAYISTIPDGTDFGAGRVVNYFITFSEPVYNANFKIGGLDVGDRADISAINGTDILPVNISDINVGAGLTINGQSVESTATPNQANPTANSIAISVDGPVSEIIVVVGNFNGDRTANLELNFYEFEYCTAIDTDNDGVNDIIDLDSDNDGIYDVDEAGFGALDTNNDGVIDANDAGGLNDVDGNGANDTAEAATPIDTLADGSFDYQNTDSDGDGCADANEAYGYASAAGADDGQFGQPDPANVNPNNGLVIEGGVDYTTGTNSSVTDPAITAGCNPCDAIASGNPDSDGDNVSDFCDIDSDNDGILNEFELNCSDGPIALGQTFSDNTGSSNNPEFINNLYAFGTADIRFGYELRRGAAWNGGVSSQNNAAVLPDGDYISTIPDGTDFANGRVVNYFITFSEPVYNASFKIGGFDVGDRADITAINGTDNLSVNLADVNVGADLTINGQTAISAATPNQTDPTANSISINVVGPVTEIIVIVGNIDGDRNANVELNFYDFEYCLTQDSDNDDVDDIFDLDSDNDGIYDVDEAGNGALDTNDDGVLDATDDVFNDLDGNGADDAAEATTPVDTLSDGSFDFQNTDSDGDGCPDANEAYDNPFTAGSDGGQFGEPDPASVDTNTGLVTETGVNYTLGTNGAVTDPADDTSCDINPSVNTVKTLTNIDGNVATTEYSQVNQVINYRITLTNNGNVAVFNPTVVDTTADASPVRGTDAPGNNDGVLDVGETWVYTASHTVTQADLDNGSYTNTAEADGSADTDNDGTGDTAVENDGSETVNAAADPSLEAVKTFAITNDVAPTGASLGDTVTYTITVTNTGNVTLDNVGIVDTFVDANGNPLTLLTGPTFDAANSDNVEGTLGVGEVATYTATYEIEQDAIDTGGFSNSVLASGDSPADTTVNDTSDDGDDNDGNTEDDVTEIVIVAEPSISLIKTTLPLEDTNGDGVEGSIDDIISYVFTVENTGNVTLTDIEIQDVLPGLTLIGGPIAQLLPDEIDSTTYTATYQITQADLDTGFITNSATVSSEAPGGDVNDSNDDIRDTSDDPNDENDNDEDGNGDPDDPTVTAVNSIFDLDVAKEVDELRPVVGAQVVFTIEAANIGNVTATNIVISEQIPSGYEFVSAITTAGTYSEIDGEWTIAQLNPDQVEILEITAEVLGFGDYENNAFVINANGGIDINQSNDGGTAAVDPICLTIYNEFSPNGDSVNETFVIDCLERFPNNKLEVFNRWGNIVYSKKGYQNDWDGTSNGRAVIEQSNGLPVGTYYYVLDLGDGSEPRVGWLYINR